MLFYFWVIQNLFNSTFFESLKTMSLNSFNIKQEMPSRYQKFAKKGLQKYLISKQNPISGILRMDLPLIKKTSISVFYGETSAGCFTESTKIKKSWGSWKMFEMEFKFWKVSSMRSKALYVYVYPNQQRGWPLRPHHTLCIID